MAGDIQHPNINKTLNLHMKHCLACHVTLFLISQRRSLYNATPYLLNPRIFMALVYLLYPSLCLGEKISILALKNLEDMTYMVCWMIGKYMFVKYRIGSLFWGEDS